MVIFQESSELNEANCRHNKLQVIVGGLASNHVTTSETSIRSKDCDDVDAVVSRNVAKVQSRRSMRGYEIKNPEG